MHRYRDAPSLKPLQTYYPAPAHSRAFHPVSMGIQSEFLILFIPDDATKIRAAAQSGLARKEQETDPSKLKTKEKHQAANIALAMPRRSAPASTPAPQTAAT